MDSTKILVIGSEGQLASALKRQAAHRDVHGIDFLFRGRNELDLLTLLAQKNSLKNSLMDIYKNDPFQAIINCSAYTAVDKAEDGLLDEKLLQQVEILNHLAVKEMGEFCAENQCHFLHISTDYVFDGLKNSPYKETDSVAPLGVYGKTKCDGENALFTLSKTKNLKGIILRTSWLYSKVDGKNFYQTMSMLGKKNPTLNVVYDQVGSPTLVDDLASFIVNRMPMILEHHNLELYHFSNEGAVSWYDFAHAIFELNDLPAKLFPILSEQFPTKVKRPQYSVLDKSKLKNKFQFEIRHWRDALFSKS